VTELNIFWFLVKGNSVASLELLHHSLKVLVSGLLSLYVIGFVLLKVFDVNPVSLFRASKHHEIQLVVT